MQNLPPPPVPAELREQLKDYPELIERIQEALNLTVLDPPGTPLFERFIWTLQGELGLFYSEVREELNVARAADDADAIARAERKEFQVYFARMRATFYLDELDEYCKKYKGMLP